MTKDKLDMPATKVEGKNPGKWEKLELAVSRMSDLPTIPNTLLRIWQITDDPESSAADLEKVITMDQALSAKLIRLVNSPYYGSREKVTSCVRAITLLGFETVRNLSVCVSVVSAFLSHSDDRCELDLEELWRHSAATGIIAQKIAAHAGSVNLGSAFTSGVLHDIGKFVLHLCLRPEYTKAVSMARDKEMLIRDAEEETLGADHSYFGGQLAQLWGFPAELREVIEEHHKIQPAGGSPGLVEIVALADAAARNLEAGSSGDNISCAVTNSAMARMGIPEEDVEGFLSDMRDLISEAYEFMNLTA